MISGSWFRRWRRLTILDHNLFIVKLTYLSIWGEFMLSSPNDVNGFWIRFCIRVCRTFQGKSNTYKAIAAKGRNDDWEIVSKALIWSLFVDINNLHKSPSFNYVTSINAFDFSTLNTTIPHQNLTYSLTSIIRNAFIYKNSNRRYKYLVLGHKETYFVKEHSEFKNKYSEDDIIKMLEILVDNIFVVYAGKVFQQTVGIPMMGTNCAPLLADIFLYSHEANIIMRINMCICQ